ncbi:prepilin peptidase [Levilactobacillus suantsaiihabitans]|uniref:Prepilin peptidase n=1 Tax=Levilactobacillus suantsaiihabitans TaxID=2487722 RepID=A0A4Z0JC04_9LACO|nr:A24 family peptidase [Levilactobacillus suantsaiihabitans]TGD19395.1 prepilin peptidase [Levilactobacillus suantsaiihabitans]
MMIILFIYGACLGSWLTAMADRYATGTSPLYPASHCEICQTPLAYWQLVPVVSYLVLRGRCHYCQQRIPPTTLVLEISCGIVLTTLTLATLRPLLWLGLWTFAALCDARTQTFPGWLVWLAWPLTVWALPWPTIILATSGLLGIQLLWRHWPTPLIGDGDLELILAYAITRGSTATAQWLLVASTLALWRARKQKRLAFLPYLVASAVGWWLIRR